MSQPKALIIYYDIGGVVMKETLQRVQRVGFVTIIANLLLAVGKFLVGIIGNSSAMISDAIHSASDVFSTIIVLIGTKLSRKQADEEHPYGHERFESIASFILALMLFMTSLQIAYLGISRFIQILNKVEINNTLPILCVIASIISIITKTWMYFYTIRTAKIANSSALKADAWHHLTDSFSSVASLLGAIGLLIGLEILDPIFCIVICLFIFKIAFDIGKESINQLIDKKASSEIENQIKNLISQQQNIIKIESLKTRQFGNKIYLDLEVIIDKNLSFEEGHKIAHQLQDYLEAMIPVIAHCTVHVSPSH